MDGSDHGDHPAIAGGVLQRNTDEDEDQQTHPHDVRHHPVAEERATHVGCRQVLRLPLAFNWARYRL